MTEQNTDETPDTPEEAFSLLRDGLTLHHLGPKPKAQQIPEIAKTRL